jgi:hypothetical protein
MPTSDGWLLNGSTISTVWRFWPRTCGATSMTFIRRMDFVVGFPLPDGAGGPASGAATCQLRADDVHLAALASRYRAGLLDPDAVIAAAFFCRRRRATVPSTAASGGRHRREYDKTIKPSR